MDGTRIINPKLLPILISIQSWKTNKKLEESWKQNLEKYKNKLKILKDEVKKEVIENENTTIFNDIRKYSIAHEQISKKLALIIEEIKKKDRANPKIFQQLKNDPLIINTKFFQGFGGRNHEELKDLAEKHKNSPKSAWKQMKNLLEKDGYDVKRLLKQAS